MLVRDHVPQILKVVKTNAAKLFCWWRIHQSHPLTCRAPMNVCTYARTPVQTILSESNRRNSKDGVHFSGDQGDTLSHVSIHCLLRERQRGFWFIPLKRMGQMSLDNTGVDAAAGGHVGSNRCITWCPLNNYFHRWIGSWYLYSTTPTHPTPSLSHGLPTIAASSGRMWLNVNILVLWTQCGLVTPSFVCDHYSPSSSCIREAY